MAATQRGGFTANATANPNTMPDKAMPVSIAGISIPITPSAPPNAITKGKTIGNTQMAGLPKNTPQRPTATIATI